MNKNELKKILKPLIKECVKEVLFDETGALSHIIKEVASGLSTKQAISETKQAPPVSANRSKNLNNTKKQLLDAIGKDAYGGINIFEGTTPAPATGNGHGPLSSVSSDDPGVDISNIFGAKSATIYQKMMEKK